MRSPPHYPDVRPFGIDTPMRGALMCAVTARSDALGLWWAVGRRKDSAQYGAWLVANAACSAVQTATAHAERLSDAPPWER